MTDISAVAIVTGAARGIGAAIARRLASDGWRVALADVLGDEVRATSDSLVGDGLSAVAIPADVTSAEQVDALVAQARARCGEIDLLVNNAGTFSYIGPLWEADPETWFRDVRVNLYGSFLCCRAVGAGMVRRGCGRIVNIVSAGGVGDPHPHSTSYACSKTALMRLTEGLAAELKPHGVKVFAVAPPAILTEMTRFIMEDPGGRRWRPGFGRALGEGRGPSPDIVADMVGRIARGEADILAGRFLPAGEGLNALLERAEEIVRDDALTLRIHR